MSLQGYHHTLTPAENDLTYFPPLAAAFPSMNERSETQSPLPAPRAATADAYNFLSDRYELLCLKAPAEFELFKIHHDSHVNYLHELCSESLQYKDQERVLGEGGRRGLGAHRRRRRNAGVLTRSF